MLTSHLSFARLITPQTVLSFFSLLSLACLLLFCVVTPADEETDVQAPTRDLKVALGRYRRGERRGKVFKDLVLGSLDGLPPDQRTVLDVGCGHGFDGDVGLQQAIAAATTRFIGIEPDPDINTPPYFSEVYRSCLESAPLPPESVQVAYTAFVLEHVKDPDQFLQKVYDCLVPGGVFWGFTIDVRHPFAKASALMQKLRLKDYYLNLLRGDRGAERYENYPTFYRVNAPKAIRRYAAGFRKVECFSLLRVGQLDYYLPRPLRWPAHALEHLAIRFGMPGAILAIRLEK